MYSLKETKTDQKEGKEIKEEMTESTNTQEESGEFDKNLELEALYEETIDKRVSTGSVVTGTVVQVGTEYIMIDIGRKMEGQAPIREFIDENGAITVSVGDEVEVLVESINNAKGFIRLSKEKAQRIKVWDDIVKAYQENQTLKGKVVERIKGGLTVDIGVPAFLPTSQATLSPVSESELEKMVGKTIEVSIIKFNRKKNNVVVSHREVLEREREEKKKKLIATLSKGDVVEGTVKNITAYGALWISAGSTACSTSPTCLGASSRIPRKRCRRVT